MNSSFPNRWSFSYLKFTTNRWSFSYLNFTKYVTNIIAEPKYKYGQQEQVTVRNLFRRLLSHFSSRVHLLLNSYSLSLAFPLCFSSLSICGLAPGFLLGSLPFDIGTSSERLAIPGLCSVELPDGNFIDQWTALSGSKLLSKYSSFGFAKPKTVIWSFSEDKSDKII